MVTHLALIALGFQRDAATPFKANQTVKASLEKKKSKDFSIDLVKGTYYVVADTISQADGKPSNVTQGTISLLKQNGASMADFSGAVMSWYEFDAEYRQVKAITIKKNGGFRFRVKNSDLTDADFYLTVVPAAKAGFVPLPSGQQVNEVSVGADGAGGSFDYLQVRYYRVNLKPGKWSISLGLRRGTDATGYLAGNFRLLSPLGGFLDDEVTKIDSTDAEARAERIYSVKKPTTVIIRAKNISNNHATLNYDVTVRPGE